MGAAANMADRMAQMESMDGAARCLETLRLQVRYFRAKSLHVIVLGTSNVIKVCLMSTNFC